MVQELLNKGVDVDLYVDRQYPSAIEAAAQAENLPSAQYLVPRGPQSTPQTEGEALCSGRLSLTIRHSFRCFKTRVQT